MPATATTPAAVYSPALRGLQATVAYSFALVMEARPCLPAKTAFDVASLLKLSADELADLLHTTTKTLRAHRQGKKRLVPAASEQFLKLLALATSTITCSIPATRISRRFGLWAGRILNLTRGLSRVSQFELRLYY